MAARVPRIVVIGGGFCGAAFAIHLARLAARPAAVTLLEPRAEPGRGVAYGTTDPAHRVNVPATLMTMFPDRPLHFDAWLRRTGAVEADPAMVSPIGLFPGRSAFGAYVVDCLAQAAGGAVAIDHRQDHAVTLAQDGKAWRIGLGSGDAFAADLVVVAVSHPPPALPDGLTALRGHPALVENPWAPEALAGIPPEAAVLIIGTGLTMADLVASLEARGHCGPITAVSRHGLLSRGHADTAGDPFGSFAGAPPATARALLRRVRVTLAAAAAAGEPWQAVIRSLTVDGQAIWAALPATERHRFLRHLRARWDVHRYRIAPQVGAAVQRGLASGRLQVIAGRLCGAKVGTRVAVEVAPRAAPAGTRQLLDADRVLLATGPAHGGAVAGTPVLASAAAAGLLRADPFGLGIAVDAGSRVLDAAGRPQDTLLVAGPLARGTFGELVGLPQVTEHAIAVAARAAAWLDAPTP